jgi:uncharacterized protein
MSSAVGIGWRPEIDLTIESLPGVEFVEVIAEGVRPDRLPESLVELRGRGLPVVPHGVSLSLGGATAPEPARLRHLAACAEALAAPLVSEHLAFVRAGAAETGHLLPVPRTRESLGVVVQNIRTAQSALAVPLALENIAALFAWPDDELTEAEFLTEVVDRTGALLLLDVANLYAAGVNFGADPVAALDQLPLDRIGYVHVAGGRLRNGSWHDTHTDPVTEPVLAVLAALAERADPPGVLLERDGDYPSPADLGASLPVRTPTAEPGAPVAGARERLAGAQGRLAAALAGAGEVPERFDLGRVRVQRQALAAKRSRAVERYEPAVAAVLGDRLGALFAQYARSVPKPDGDSRADVAGFVEYLRSARVLRGTRRRPRLGRAAPTLGP